MTATLRERAEGTAKEVMSIVRDKHPELHSKEVADAIEIAITKALLEERSRCASVAAQCCSPDNDKAHQIREEVNRVNSVLIANLEAMR